MNIRRSLQPSRCTEKSRACRGGFTLIEVLLVLGIIIVMLAMVVPNFIGSQQEAYVKATRASISGFEKAVEIYAVANDGIYPTGDTETVLELLLQPVDKTTGQPRPPYLSKIPLDAWQNQLQYEYPPTGDRQNSAGIPAIWSMGLDGQDGTEDDVTNWQDPGTI